MRRLLLLMPLLAFAGSLLAASFDLTLPPKDGEKYKSGAYRLWIPENLQKIRVVIVRQHGCGRNGIDHADDLQWQALARKHGGALLGSHFVQDKECKDWFDPANGSERAFLEALATFAEQSKHPELKDAPWAIWGHSGGALWAMHMLDRHPRRVVTVVARSMALEKLNEAALNVPLMLNYGEKEKTGQFERVHKVSSAAYATYRPGGAPWTLAVDPKSSHDCRDSRQVAIPWLDAVLARRLPATPGQLLDVDKTQEWLGDPETYAIARADLYKGEKSKASWLPNESVAKKWSEFVKTGNVQDTTAPPRPYDVRTRAAGGENFVLSWKCDGDLDSGLKEFHIFANGKKLGSVGGEKTRANKDGRVQIWNYGDEPEPRLPKFEYAFPVAKGGRVSLTITSENHAGLQSPPSDEVLLLVN